MDYALIGGLNFTMAMLMAPLVTILTRRLGTAPPMMLGCLLQAGGFIAASFSTEIWQLFLTQGVLVGVGVGCVYIPSLPIISQWFEKKRSLANGISSAGSGIGGLLFSFVSEAIISRVSVAWALRFMGILSGCVLLIACLLLRTRNKIIQPTQRAFDVQLLRRVDVLLLLSWGFISMLGYMTLLFSLANFARSIGLSEQQASTVNALLNLGTAIGRPLTGLASDRFGRIEVAGVLTCICGLLCFALWLPATSYGLLIFFALITGGIFGVFWVVRTHCRRQRTDTDTSIDHRPNLR
jgi:MFS family permease